MGMLNGNAVDHMWYSSSIEPPLRRNYTLWGSRSLTKTQ